mmetsp:Transcript_12343/g.12423  ORF Transcript_12343/g.12423 Transcript_12343/m.12423 type:complete len:442 (-) Transcript_12343:331-1656(-)|eukprot:CAMPEP_0182421258 /NCGR_PEP_ID=MMETSP1167-20130531/6572_1 /TAXON_ID=2988 /ORGANISM="Mallomonas Sp, Strain CCMP3275" /LENGTH=441 /DNA_ID=CAMNT_0024598211 /DNA_START=85 /DNA_END=1410 /DNA_ORIENTATION=+
MSRSSKSKKEKKGRRRQDEGDDSFTSNYASDSEVSVISSRTDMSINSGISGDDYGVSESINESYEIFLLGVDNLMEKRTSTRIEALKSILRVFQSSSIDVCESVSNNRETLMQNLSKLIRRPSSELEGLLAIDVYCMTCLALGPEEDGVLQIFSPILRTLMKSSGYDRVRESAVGALAFTSLICATCLHDTDVWDAVEDVLCCESEGRSVDKSLQAAAISAWCLVCTVMPDDEVLTRSKNRVFEATVDLLCDSTDTDVRVSCGVCLAQLWEAADRLHPNLEADVSGNLLCESFEIVHRALDTLKAMSRDSNKRVSKRDRKEQRAAFRPLEAWVLNGERPDNAVQLEGATVVCDSFRRLTLLDALRGVLKDGFTSAARVYPTVRQMLEIAYLSEVMTERGDNKGKSTSEGRVRTTQRKHDRRMRNDAKHASIDSDLWSGFDE